MDEKLQKLGKMSSCVAFVLCFLGGLWILIFEGFSTDDATSTGLGLYFIGKAFFVGPMLYIATVKLFEK